MLHKIGTWYGFYRDEGQRKEVEIDIVALDEKETGILFAECKWQDLRQRDAEQVLSGLKEKADSSIGISAKEKSILQYLREKLKEKRHSEKTALLHGICTTANFTTPPHPLRTTKRPPLHSLIPFTHRPVGV